MGTKVYVVTEGSYSDYGIVAIFSTHALAEAYIAEAKKEYDSDDSRIEEYTLDERTEERALPVWRAMIILADGRIREDGQRIELWYRRVNEPITREATVAFGRSLDSQEHANKIAIEMRQEWLRLREIAGDTP